MSHTKTISLDFSICSPAARRVRAPATEAQISDHEEQLLRADGLLEEWYAWSETYRPALGIPGCSPSCRQAQSSKQWQSTSEIAEESARKTTMAAVECCIDALSIPHRRAIGVEMRNRNCGAKVWRSQSSDSFTAALNAILPLMRQRLLLS